jgi:hypothetical protein
MGATFEASSDEVIARLADAAYQTALRHGLKKSFLEVELAIWRSLQRAFRREIERRESSELVETAGCSA